MESPSMDTSDGDPAIVVPPSRGAVYPRRGPDLTLQVPTIARNTPWGTCLRRISWKEAPQRSICLASEVAFGAWSLPRANTGQFVQAISTEMWSLASPQIAGWRAREGRRPQRRRDPPMMEPRTPRMISRPTDEPIERIADRAADSTMPSWRPPRGPVVPNSTPPRLPSTPPAALGAGAGAGAGADADQSGAMPASGAVAAGAFRLAGVAATRPLSVSYADTRSTVFS